MTEEFIFVLLCLLVGGGFLARHREKKQWNGGISPHDGSKWKSFDTDSSGATGYKDDSGNYFWRSWDFS